MSRGRGGRRGSRRRSSNSGCRNPFLVGVLTIAALTMMLLSRTFRK